MQLEPSQVVLYFLLYLWWLPEHSDPWQVDWECLLYLLLTPLQSDPVQVEWMRLFLVLIEWMEPEALVRLEWYLLAPRRLV